MLQKWCEFADRGPEWKPSRWSSICSRHFYESAYRDHLTRRCLKKSAVPTIKSKPSISCESYHIPESLMSLDPTNDSTSEINRKTDISECRLCGEHITEDALNALCCSIEDNEISSLLEKCLPSIRITVENQRSSSVCSKCLSDLRHFSEFIDKVLTFQRDMGILIASNALKNSIPVSMNSSLRPLTTASNVFIKQEPINVKQEIQDNFTNKSSNNRILSTPTKTTEPSRVNAFCSECDRIFVSQAELSSHNCQQTSSDFASANPNSNCEIMEIITLNSNPVSFIDLAAEEEATVDFNQRKRVDIEHAYARKPTLPFKQEIEMSEESENEEPTPTPINQSNGKKSFVATESMVERSVNMHSLQNKTCPICSAEFKSIYDYLLHKNKVHASGHQCSQCKRRFPTQSSLKYHERFSCDTDAKRFFYSCGFCGKVVQNQFKVREHIRQCQTRRKQNWTREFPCELCGKIFQSRANLKQHGITHDRESAIVCGICSKKFKRVSGLNQHIRSYHYGIKPYSCPVCNYGYALKGDMHRCRHSALKKKIYSTDKVQPNEN